MSHYNKRTDSNQQLVIDALRQAGASVQSLHTAGQGIPDLLVGFRGKNYLLEVKTEAGEQNSRQRAWHANWRGQAVMVRTINEALKAVGAI